MPDANPFKDKGELAKSFGSVSHRNLLGIALNQKGEIWAHEMGPKSGDELNSILYRAHYGSPIVSKAFIIVLQLSQRTIPYSNVHASPTPSVPILYSSARPVG
jgi:glucose/arabinose dehydrogenase